MTFQFSLPLEIDKESPVEMYTGPQELFKHIGHHNHILLFQKARQAYLSQFGYSERNIEGYIMFIVEVNCTYKRELFHQDKIEVKCRVDGIREKVFFMSYAIEKDGLVCALGKTKSVCADPVFKKAVPVPGGFAAAVSKYENFTQPAGKPVSPAV